MVRLLLGLSMILFRVMDRRIPCLIPILYPSTQADIHSLPSFSLHLGPPHARNNRVLRWPTRKILIDKKICIARLPKKQLLSLETPKRTISIDKKPVSPVTLRNGEIYQLLYLVMLFRVVFSAPCQISDADYCACYCSCSVLAVAFLKSGRKVEINYVASDRSRRHHPTCIVNVMNVAVASSKCCS
jgi:hypothetical protein